MSDPTVRGIVHVIEETKTYGQKGFRKRLVVLEQDKGSFSNYVPIDFTKDDCDKVDELTVGDEVEVKYRISGRKWQKDPSSEVKYFCNLEALMFQIIGGGTPGSNTHSHVSDPNAAFAEASEDDAPF